MQRIRKIKITRPTLKGNNATYFYTGRFDEELQEQEESLILEEAEKIIQAANTLELNKELWKDRAQFELSKNG